MRSQRPFPRLVGLLVLTCLALPAVADSRPVTLDGSIVKSGGLEPLVGARLHAADPQTGELYSSVPTDPTGSFVLPNLPPATYRLAVEADGGLYLVEAPLPVAPGVIRTLNLAVNSGTGRRGSRDDSQVGRKLEIWENPLTAALGLSGIATVLGLTFGDDGEAPVSPTLP